MSSVVYNLTRKSEWLGRGLRWKYDAEEIKEWVAAMTALNSLLKVVETKPRTDT